MESGIAALLGFSIRGETCCDSRENRMWKTLWIMCITLCSPILSKTLCQILAESKGREILRRECGKM